jgi:hypothetical protein
VRRVNESGLGHLVGRFCRFQAAKSRPGPPEYLAWARTCAKKADAVRVADIPEVLVRVLRPSVSRISDASSNPAIGFDGSPNLPPTGSWLPSLSKTWGLPVGATFTACAPNRTPPSFLDRGLANPRSDFSNGSNRYPSQGSVQMYFGLLKNSWT